MTKTIAAAVMLLLTSCGFTPEGDLARETIREKGAQAYDAGIENAEWFLCNAASIGSIRRKFGRDPQLADAYRTLCERKADVVTVKPAVLP